MALPAEPKYSYYIPRGRLRLSFEKFDTPTGWIFVDMGMDNCLNMAWSINSTNVYLWAQVNATTVYQWAL